MLQRSADGVGYSMQKQADLQRTVGELEAELEQVTHLFPHTVSFHRLTIHCSYKARRTAPPAASIKHIQTKNDAWKR